MSGHKTTETPFEQSLMDAAKIDSLNITAPRDVDAESSRPRLQATTRPVDNPHKRPDEPIVHQASTSLETAANDMFIPFLRSGLRDVTDPSGSTFLPNAYVLYQVVHFMDLIMSQAYYFTRSQPLWHPYISRIYFGILFIMQVLRCQNQVNNLNFVSRSFLNSFFESFAPESLMIPRPLVPLFRSIAASATSNPNSGPVYPALPHRFGPDNSNDIIRTGTEPFHLPNIPMLIGFLNRLTSNEAQTDEYIFQLGRVGRLVAKKRAARCQIRTRRTV